MSAVVNRALMQPGWLMDGHKPPEGLSRAIAWQVGEADERHGFSAPATAGVRRTCKNEYRKQRHCKCFRHVFFPRASAERRSIALRGINQALAATAMPSRARDAHCVGTSC
jgi:hypothetical protein